MGPPHPRPFREIAVAGQWCQDCGWSLHCIRGSCVGCILADLVVHRWGLQFSWVLSASTAGIRVAAAVLAAEVGPLPRLWKLQGPSPGSWGWLLQENSMNSPSAFYIFFRFEKFLLYKPATPNKHLASHTAQAHPNQLGDSPGQGPSRPNSSQPWSTFSAGAHCPCVFLTSSLFLPL